MLKDWGYVLWLTLLQCILFTLPEHHALLMKLGSPERILEAGAVNDISGPSATVNLGALSIRGPKLVYCTQGSEQVWHHPRHNQSFPILLTRNVEPSAVHILRQSFRSHAQIPGALSCQISCNFHNSKNECVHCQMLLMKAKMESSLTWERGWGGRVEGTEL